MFIYFNVQFYMTYRFWKQSSSMNYFHSIRGATGYFFCFNRTIHKLCTASFEIYKIFIRPNFSHILYFYIPLIFSSVCLYVYSNVCIFSLFVKYFAPMDSLSLFYGKILHKLIHTVCQRSLDPFCIVNYYK